MPEPECQKIIFIKSPTPFCNLLIFLSHLGDGDLEAFSGLGFSFLVSAAAGVVVAAGAEAAGFFSFPPFAPPRAPLPLEEEEDEDRERELDPGKKKGYWKG